MSPDPFDTVMLRSIEVKNRFILAAAASVCTADESGVIKTGRIFTELVQNYQMTGQLLS